MKDAFGREPLPSLILIGFAFLLGAGRCLRGALLSLFKGPGLSEYISTNSDEFAYLLTVPVLAMAGLSSPSDLLYVKLTILPAIYLISASSIKKWFSVFDDNLVRNWVVKFMVFANSAGGLAIKWMLLMALAIWYFASAIYAAPDFLEYKNLLG